MTWKAAYLIHGDDHGRISERRASLRAKAEQESGIGSVEVFEGETATPEQVVGALTAMTFAIGRRFVIVDGVERWKEADAEPVAAAMEGCEDLTVAFFAREEGRAKAPEKLHAGVKAVGGAIAAEGAVKPWELPKWAQQQATALGIELDSQAARVLVGQVGERQQRLLRELEKLSLEFGAGAHLSAEDVHDASSTSSERKVWALGDALVEGDARKALAVLTELRAQGERVPGLIYNMARRLRDALAVAEELAAGKSESSAGASLRMPPKIKREFIAAVAARDVDAYRRAIELIADLELQSRGGGPAPPASEDTAAVRAVVSASV